MKNTFTIDQVRRFWDGVAHKYEPANEQVGYVHYERYEHGLRLLALQPGERVLNVWARMGACIPYLRSVPNITLYNREVSPAFIQVMKERYPEENIAETDLFDFSEFEDNSIDKIISLETLEHTPNPSQLLKELHRIVKPGGTIVMSLPPRGFEIATRIWDVLFDNHGEGPHLFLWPWQVRRLLKEAGFTVQYCKPSIIFPLGKEAWERRSEKLLSPIISKTPLAWFLAVRYFYTATK